MGYVWCEIRQQSSEEPCDETSFRKNEPKEIAMKKIKIWISENGKTIRIKKCVRHLFEN